MKSACLTIISISYGSPSSWSGSLISSRRNSPCCKSLVIPCRNACFVSGSEIFPHVTRYLACIWNSLLYCPNVSLVRIPFSAYVTTNCSNSPLEYHFLSVRLGYWSVIACFISNHVVLGSLIFSSISYSSTTSVLI